MIAKRYVPFWQEKSMQEMSQEEWESLCDRCGKCCLQKLQDDETDEIYYTNLACQYLNIQHCQCQVYPQRLEKVAACADLTLDKLEEFSWLPDTCSYRVLSETGDLPNWHPLVTGSHREMIRQGLRVSAYAVSENSVAEEDWDTHLIRWVHGMPEPLD